MTRKNSENSQQAAQFMNAVNQRVVEAVIPNHAVRQLPIAPFIGQLGDSGILQPEVSARLLNTAIVDGALRTLPGTHPCDGFYATLLERK